MQWPIARELMVACKLPLLHAERMNHDRLHRASALAAPTAGYGAYLVRVGCTGCHGAKLAGRLIADGVPSRPPASNFTPADPTMTWAEDDFRRLLRDGRCTDGTPVNSAMPVRVLGTLTDDECTPSGRTCGRFPPRRRLACKRSLNHAARTRRAVQRRR